MSDRIAFSLEGLAKPNLSVRGHWAPIFYEPMNGSGERLVIAVAAINESSFSLASAKGLSKLNCFYGRDGENVIFLIKLGLEGLEGDLAQRGILALRDPRPSLTGIHIGSLREGAGASLEAIASAWLSSISSLDSAAQGILDISSREMASVAAEKIREDAGRDRLPMLVYEEVVKARPALGNFFRPEVRPKEKRTRARSPLGAAVIDFEGKRLVANFCLIKPTRPNQLAKTEIKPRLWDLKVHRDRPRDGASLFQSTQEHELLVHRPARNDPTVDAKQIVLVEEALEELEKQADQENIRLRPVTSVQEITAHILEREAA